MHAVFLICSFNAIMEHGLTWSTQELQLSYVLYMSKWSCYLTSDGLMDEKWAKKEFKKS